MFYANKNSEDPTAAIKWRLLVDFNTRPFSLFNLFPVCQNWYKLQAGTNFNILS